MRQLIARLDAAPVEERFAAGGGASAWHPVEDSWRNIEDDPTGAGLALIVPFARWQSERDRWWLWAGKLGVRIAPADRVEQLESDLKRLALVAIEFTGPSEGRGYSQARVLRDRYAFTGELRAIGHVKLDQVFFLARCGFDALELAEGVDVHRALAALDQFDVAYQPGARDTVALRQRYPGQPG